MDAVIQSRIAAALAAPKTHAVLTLRDDGGVTRHETRSLKTAENHAVGERRKVGRQFLDRATDRPYRVVGVEIVKI